MAVPHIYTRVICKTCRAPIDIEYLGLALNMRIAGTIRNPGQIRCLNCGAAHNYVERDLQLSVKDDAPSRKH